MVGLNGSGYYTPCPNKKHVTTFYTITLTMCPITIIFGILSSQSMRHRKMFHFPPHLSSATTLPWEITEHKNDQFRRKQHIVL